MEYRPLGTTGLDVSVLSLGTMMFGDQLTERDGHAQMDVAIERGINLFDTAEHYPVPPRRETQGATESIVGSWLARSGQRHKVLLATKAVGPAHPGRISSGHVRDGNNHLTRANLEAALEASLKRLRTDYVDLYQLHWPDRCTNFFGHLDYEPVDGEESVPIEETLAVLGDFVKAGKVRFIGLSNETPWGMARYLHLAATRNLPRIASIQNPYNLLNRSFDIGCAEIAVRERVSLLAYSPLAFGALTGKYLGGAKPPGARLTLMDRFARYSGERSQAAIRAYVDLARDHGLDPAQMALAWAVRRRVMTSAIIGATSLAQLDVLLGSLTIDLPQSVVTAIDRIHAGNPNPAP